jgi:hypothetical protein
MLLNHRPNKIIITGKSGCGKSTYWNRYILNSFGGRYGQIFIFDHQGEFSFRNGIQPCYNSDDLERAYPSGLICFDPAEMYPGETPEAFDWFCSFTFELRKWIVSNSQQPEQESIALFACDELQQISDVYSIPQPFASIIETGRRYGIDTLLIAQQINLVNNRLRNQATECVTFCHLDPLVLGAMQDWQFDPNEVASLDYPGEYLICNYQNGEKQRGHLFKESDKSATVEKTDAVPEEKNETSVDNPPERVIEQPTD